MIELKLTEDQAEEVKGMLKASIIRMTEWVNDAKRRDAQSEVSHLEDMRGKRSDLQMEILRQMKAPAENKAGCMRCGATDSKLEKGLFCNDKCYREYIEEFR